MQYNIIRVILGSLFIFSGWSKAIDPVGVSYKIEEYISSFGLDFLDQMSQPIAVLLCSLELFIGIMLFFKLWQKVISYITFAFMLFFTLVTLFIYAFPSLGVKDCGCFGEAFTLTNGQTFFKNIIFLALAFYYAKHNFVTHINNNNRFYYNKAFMTIRKKQQLKALRFVVYLFVAGFSIGIPLYSAIYLPPYTHLPFDVGETLGKSVNTSDENVTTKLIYKNIKSGEVKKFDIDDPTWQDAETWSYVDTETIGGDNDGGYSVNSISIYDAEKENITEQITSKEGYNFFIIAQNIDDIEYSDITNLRNLNQLHSNGKINLSVLTATEINRAKASLSTQGMSSVEVYNVDLTELKSLLRSKKGVILINNNIISGKWSFNDKLFINITYADIQPLIDWGENGKLLYFIICGLFIAIMMYLIFVYHSTKR